MIPVVGDIITKTVGKVVSRLAEHYLPATMSEAEKDDFKLQAQRLAIEEYKVAIADVEGARTLASKEGQDAPRWTRVLTVTHRPMWSFIILAIFAWTVIAPYLGYPAVPLTDIHKDIIETVIIFYFGGRSIEKTAGVLRGM